MEIREISSLEVIFNSTKHTGGTECFKNKPKLLTYITIMEV